MKETLLHYTFTKKALSMIIKKCKFSLNVKIIDLFGFTIKKK